MAIAILVIEGFSDNLFELVWLVARSSWECQDCAVVAITVNTIKMAYVVTKIMLCNMKASI